jgi:light-regulated signal transduction histidine kinase (bacteriophytochrome)
VKNIVSDLRMFTHPDTESRDQVDIGDVIKTALRFLSNEWKDTCVSSSSSAPRSPSGPTRTSSSTWWSTCFKMPSTRLRQNVRWRREADDLGPDRARAEQERAVIRDNGTGITAEHLDKIFDPFYTTKDVGQGMGLGLSICLSHRAGIRGPDCGADRTRPVL